MPDQGEVEEVPLRHESDKLAVRRNVPEIRGLEGKVSQDSIHRRQFLVRDLQELFPPIPSSPYINWSVEG